MSSKQLKNAAQLVILVALLLSGAAIGVATGSAAPSGQHLTTSPTSAPMLTDTPNPTDTPEPTDTPTNEPVSPTATDTPTPWVDGTPIPPSDTPTMTSTPSPTPTPSCLDQFEPDNDPAHAGYPDPDQLQHHTFCRTPGQPNNDADWLRLSGAGPGNYDLVLVTQAQGISAHTVMTVYDSSFNVLQTSGGPSGWAQVMVHVDEFAVDYVVVVNYDGSGGADPDYGYDLAYYAIHDTPGPGATDTPTPFPTCLDQYEPDNEPAHASRIFSGHHTFCLSPDHPNNDIDWFYEDWAPACYIYSLSTQAQGISARTVMTLYDGSFNVLQTSGGPNGWAQVDFLECGGTTYYVAVTNYDGTGGFDPNYGYDLLAEYIHVTPVPPSPIPTPTPTECPSQFVDITGNVFYTAIHYLHCIGVISGTDPTHYSPGSTATRAQFAKIVVLGFNLSIRTPANGQTFSDVPRNYFAYAYIETGYTDGILSGFDAATCQANGQPYPCYLPNRPISRGELTKLVVNAAHYPLWTPIGGGQSFSDVPSSNVFYVSIETAAYNSLINGYPDHTFRPNNWIRRDEMAQIVYMGMINH